MPDSVSLVRFSASAARGFGISSTHFVVHCTRRDDCGCGWGGYVWWSGRYRVKEQEGRTDGEACRCGQCHANWRVVTWQPHAGEARDTPIRGLPSGGFGPQARADGVAALKELPAARAACDMPARPPAEGTAGIGRTGNHESEEPAEHPMSPDVTVPGHVIRPYSWLHAARSDASPDPRGRGRAALLCRPATCPSPWQCPSQTGPHRT